MRTQVQQTSLWAYAELKASPKELGRRQKEVLYIIQNYSPLVPYQGVTNNETAKQLNVGANQITGRCKELRDMGLVKELCRRPDSYTKKKSIAWVAA